jgi:hypothetical protein
MQDAIVAGVVVSQPVGNLGDYVWIDVVHRLSDVGDGSRVRPPESAMLEQQTDDGA